MDAAGSAYVAGVTPSPNFPLVNPEQSTLNGSLDAFVSKVSSAGALLYSTYLGGSGIDNANAIAVDTNGYAYIAGYTYSSDFPAVSPLQATAGSPTGIDAFVAKLVPAGNALTFSTYLGGNDSSTAMGVAIDPSGNVYITGWTLSTNFPTLNALSNPERRQLWPVCHKISFQCRSGKRERWRPLPGSGTAQSFTFQYSDGNGADRFQHGQERRSIPLPVKRALISIIFQPRAEYARSVDRFGRAAGFAHRARQWHGPEQPMRAERRRIQHVAVG